MTDPNADELIKFDVRLERDTLLDLALIAHDNFVTLEDLMVRVLADSVARWSRPSPLSRNTREGRYTGAWGGHHLRTNELRYYCGAPYADLAWALASHRAGGPLFAPRARRHPNHG